MRARYWTILALAIVLIAPFLLRAFLPLPPWREREGVRAELQAITPAETDRVIIVTPHVEGIKREFAQAFSDYYSQKFNRQVLVDFRDVGGANEIVQSFNHSKSLFNSSKTYGIDVVWGGGDFVFDKQLKPGGFLSPIPPTDPMTAFLKSVFPHRVENGITLYDESPAGPSWFAAALSSFGILYNKDVVRYLNAPSPTTWDDLADPRYFDWIILANPTQSGSARAAFMFIVESKMVAAAQNHADENAAWAQGMGLIRLIASNTRSFMDGANTLPAVVSSGDAAAAMVIDYYGRSQVAAISADNASRLAYIEPRGATAYSSDPIALVAGAPHREVAERFIRFVLSPQGQKLWFTPAASPGGPRETTLWRLPAAPGAYADRNHLPYNVNPFEPGVNLTPSPRREDTFAFLGDLIDVSCIGPLDELKSARIAIEASPQRDILRQKLALFPHDRTWALAQAKAYAAADALAKLEMRRTWQEQFRAEYIHLRDLATQSQTAEAAQ
jgi:iron(III) transport system substrate-binding protein